MKRNDTVASGRGRNASNPEDGGATKDELDKTAEAHPLPQNFKQLMTEYIGCSVSEVFKQIFDVGAAYPHEKFFEENGE